MRKFMLSGKRIWVAGHAGMVGRAVVRALEGLDEKAPADILTIGRQDLDLRDQAAVTLWMNDHRPDMIVLAAATVGGIADNAARPADFLYDNLMIEVNIIHQAFRQNVEKLLFLGSSCIYPREAVQPLVPGALLTGALEPTNEAYALAKIAGIKLCQAYNRQENCRFISAMPCNLYGPYDRFDEQRSHVIPALMLRMHKAKQRGEASLKIWGTGKPLREFLHVDDLARALIFLLEHHEGDAPVNIGSGQEVSITDLAQLMADITGYDGDILFDPHTPDGTPRKILDSSLMKSYGWQPALDLERGLRETYGWFCHHEQTICKRAA